jgi:hypothetical protein
MADIYPYLIEAGDEQALAYLEDHPEPGGVVARTYLGQAIPALTGRRTYVGIASWTPDYDERGVQAGLLVSGRLGPRRAQAFVRETGATFVLVDCGIGGDLSEVLGDLVVEEARFGCASVYRVG